jgi:N utilization substance protein B
LCELMHFSSIPPKVTINEYVELAKLYSTPKSKDFVNGVVDRLTKQLTKDGRIKKEGRGLVS